MRRPILLLAGLFLALLGLMAAKSLLVQAPPLRAQPTAGEFDALRAKTRLASVLGDQRPHPADTAANDAVRARIVALLQDMGLRPEVRDQLACNELTKQRGVSCARVRNVIAMIGPAAGKAVLLNAHYDSTPVGPGAGDDGIGVATLLEVASIVKDQPLKRPVILLFNEGEELGLIGARAFLADPLSRNVDSLVNLEARGVRGPVHMFETNRPNAAAISLFAQAVNRPMGSSLSTDVYRLLPNYTDVNSFAERGWLTLNLAPTGNETRYHSAGDDLAALDPATLQHMGDQTLTLARALATGERRLSGGDRIFMDVAGRTLVALPMTVGIVLLAGLLLGFGVLAWTGGGGIRGLSVAVGALAGSTALAWLALTLIGAVSHAMFWRAQPVWTHLAGYASAILVATVLLATIGRSASQPQLRPSFWLVCVAFGAMIGIAAPGGIIFFLFPPLAQLIGAFAARWWKPAERLGAMLAIALLYLTWGALLGVLEEVLNQGPMWIFAPLGALIILPILIEAKPLIDRLRWRDAPAVAGMLTLAGWAAAAGAPAYSADRQQRFVVQHVTDASSGKAFWSVLNDGAPLPPAYRSAGKWYRGKLPFSRRPRWLAAAAVDPGVKPPGLQRLSEVRNGGERTLTLRLNANGNDRIELIAPEDAKIRSAGVPGFVRRIEAQENGQYYLDCFGRSCDGLVLQLTTSQTKPIPFLIVGTRGVLPPSAAPLLAARPQFARPQYNRDESIAFARRNL